MDYFNDSPSEQTDDAGTPELTSSAPSENDKDKCPVCFTTPEEAKVCSSCEQSCCVSCYAKWLTNQIVELGRAQVFCSTCSALAPREDVAKYCTTDVVRRYEFAMSRREHARNRHALWCASCHALLRSTREKVNLAVVCARCGESTCSRCTMPTHKGVSCARPRRQAFQILRNVKWRRKNTKRCPSCGVHIEKDGGCSDMECTHCGESFCYRCGTQYSLSTDCRCERMHRLSRGAARIGGLAITSPFILIALAIGLPAAVLLYYTSPYYRREKADRIIEELCKIDHRFRYLSKAFGDGGSTMGDGTYFEDDGSTGGDDDDDEDSESGERSLPEEIQRAINWERRSIEDTIRTTVVVLNDSTRHLDLFWINYEGEYEHYAEIAPGATHVQLSFATHPFVLFDQRSRREMLAFEARSETAVAVVRGNIDMDMDMDDMPMFTTQLVYIEESSTRSEQSNEENRTTEEQPNEIPVEEE